MYNAFFLLGMRSPVCYIIVSVTSLTYIPYLGIVCVVMYWKIGQFKDSETLSGLKGSICFIRKALRRKFVMNLYIKKKQV